MSGNLGGFDAGSVEPNNYDVVPAGEYEACIVNSGVQDTKRGDGKMLKLELQILSGPFKGRKVFEQLNLWNPSTKAVEIARGTLSAICRAVGVMTPDDSSELHDRPMLVKVAIESSPGYQDQNKVKAYKPAKAGTKPPAQQALREQIEAAQERTLPPPNDEIPF